MLGSDDRRQLAKVDANKSIANCSNIWEATRKSQLDFELLYYHMT